jgi:hypothetical protein
MALFNRAIQQAHPRVREKRGPRINGAPIEPFIGWMAPTGSRVPRVRGFARLRAALG